MRKQAKGMRLLALLLVCALLTGCRKSDYIENLSYAIVLGVDRAAYGDFRLTVKCPKLAGDPGGEGSGYFTLSAEGGSFSEALDEMRMVIPRTLNLSALALIVVSQEVAQSLRMPALTREMVANKRLYSAVYFAVCEGDAGNFVEQQEPLFGKRLSEGIVALVEHTGKLGAIPESRLADVYYQTVSVYSDPCMMLCALNDGSASREDEPGDSLPEDAPSESENRNVYLGCALMKNGRMVGTLNGRETQLMRLLSGELDSMTYSWDGGTASLTLDRPREASVNVKTSPVVLRLALDFSALDVEGDGEMDLSELNAHLKSDLMDVIRRCQRLEVEPFGFAFLAAGKFANLSSWIAFDWQKRFTEAKIDLSVALTEVES